METIFTPWRHSYIIGNSANSAHAGDAAHTECFFCTAAADPRSVFSADSLVVARGEHHLVMLNLHPYSSGHLMVAPFSHWASPQEADAAALSEFWPLVLRAQRVLQKAYSPHGFNLGMNLGAPAGAGVPGHYHFHLVPRWNGDTNFMSVLAEVRLVPEDLGQARERLRALFAQEET